MSDGGDSGFGGDDGSNDHRDDQASFHTGDNFTDMGQSFYGNMLRRGDDGRDGGYGGSLSGLTNDSEAIPPRANPLRPPSPARSKASAFSQPHQQRSPGSDESSVKHEPDFGDGYPLRRTGTHESGLAAHFERQRRPSAATIPSQDGHRTASQLQHRTENPVQSLGGNVNNNGEGSSKDTNTYALLMRHRRQSMGLDELLNKWNFGDEPSPDQTQSGAFQPRYRSASPHRPAPRVLERPTSPEPQDEGALTSRRRRKRRRSKHGRGSGNGGQ